MSTRNTLHRGHRSGRLVLAWPFSITSSVVSWSFPGLLAFLQSPFTSTLRLHEQSRVPFLEQGFVAPCPQTVLRTPPTPYTTRCDFVSLYRAVYAPQTLLHRVSGTGLFIFHCMSPLVPRKILQTPSVAWVCNLRPSPYVHKSTRSASSIYIDEATYRFACAVACSFANWELTALIAQPPLPWTTGVNG